MKFEWTQATLDEVCVLITDGAHNSPRSVDNGEYMASVKDFSEYGIDFSSCRKISKEDYGILKKQGCVPEEDILVGKDGARYFEDIVIYRQSEKPALLSSIAILRVDKNKLTPEFLYYTLKSPITKRDVRDNYGSGSAIPRIVLKDFKRMPIAFPGLEEQRKITEIGTNIDNKIQLNIKINKNLEKQARAIFKAWFVDFEPFHEPMVTSPIGYKVPESLSMVQIGEMPHILETGKRPKGGAVDNGIPSIGAENVKQLGVFDSSSAKYIPCDFASALNSTLQHLGGRP